MNVRTQSVNFNAEPELLDFVEQKLNKLDQFYDQIVDAEVFLKVENVNDGINKLAEVRINIPGNDLIVKKQCRTFEEAIDQSVDVLKRQINKRKERVRGV
jgi:putative sigma-54 modulation protein